MNSHICMAHCVTLCTTLKTSKQKRLFLNPLSSSIQFTTQPHKELHQHKAGGTGTASATELPRDTAGCSRQETRAGARGRRLLIPQHAHLGGAHKPAPPPCFSCQSHTNTQVVCRCINHRASENYPFTRILVIPTHKSRFLAHLI